ncbi:MAG TPA: hypothetical protein VHC95_07160 [Opitutales bacterium]|nr:hypothetical protein [Opitutales bacterium]
MNLLYVMRQRRRALLGIFVAVAAIYLGWSAIFGRVYTAYAQVSDYNARSAGQVTSREALAMYLSPLYSDGLLRKVAAGLSETDRRNLLAPYQHWFQWSAGSGAVEILMSGRTITATDRLVDVGFRHPDPKVAAQIANAMAAEFVAECNAAKSDRETKSLGDLRAKLTGEEKKVAGLQKQMQDLSAQYDMTNFNTGSDTVYLQAIADMNKQVIDLKSRLDSLDLRRQQVVDQTAAKKPVWDLDFVRGQLHIADLYQAAQDAAINVQNLQNQGFQPESPAMTDAKARMDTAVNALTSATESVVRQLSADLQEAQNNYLQASKRLQDMQSKNQDLTAARGTYDGLRKKYETENQVLNQLRVTVADAETQFNLTDPIYALLAKADPPDTADPLPWAKLGARAAGWGAGAGLLALVGLAILRPPPKAEREEYERRRRRHRHFHSSSSGPSSSSSSSKSSRRHSGSRSSDSSSSSRHRH